MSIVRAFRGLRPRPDLASRVASPPYDVLNTAEARAMAEGNPHSFLRVNRAELELDPGMDPHDPAVYAHAAKNLARMETEGSLLRDPEPCFYLYRLTMGGRSQTGLVALTSVDEYRAGVVKKHEHTRPAKVADRADHIEALAAQVGPVFSTFRPTAPVRALFTAATQSTPDVDFVADDGVRHELWVVADPATVGAITRAFADVPALYIADGHHRSEAASEVLRRAEAHGAVSPDDPRRFFLNVLFASNELTILPYNRVVRPDEALPVANVVARAQDRFVVRKVEGPVTPSARHHFGLYGDGTWYELEATEGSFDAGHPTQSIDAAILSDSLLAPVLDITDLRTDARIDFVGGIRGVEELVRLVDSGEHGMAFSLFPTSIDQLLAVADAGEVMPPKSTWFEPKLRSGMVVNPLRS